jgi:hypothetical protein
MGWRTDNDEFFDQVSRGEERDPDTGPCPLCAIRCLRCGVPMHQHTQAGLIECAWRGYPCVNCGHPPHPDNAPNRCERYTHQADTLRERELRLLTAWKRDARGPFYTYRHCSKHHHGKPEAA